MSESSGKKILLIEQDTAITQALTERLAAKGYELRSLVEPQKTIEEISSFRPDLVVLSFAFPEIDCFPILERIRSLSDKILADVSVVIGSRSGDVVEIGRALRLGVKDYYVSASFDPDQTTGKIERLLIPANAPAPEAADERPKLLIVEDDKFLRDLAFQKFSREQLQVITAMDGEQGIALAEKEKPVVMLLDILLPGIDGYEVLRRVRANPALKGMHIAMLSNFGQREDVEKALSLGANQFFVKANYTLDEIVGEVRKMLMKPK